MLLDAAHEIERELELLVVLRVERDVGGGARFFLFLVAALQVALQLRLALGLDLALELIGQILDQIDLGRDPLGLDRAAGGSEVRAVVSFRAPKVPIGITVCTEPLPNEREPRSVARLWSCNAPATISEAEAEPPLISTISGLPFVRSPGRAL